jgi:predicted secreted Zn-dependent protease
MHRAMKARGPVVNGTRGYGITLVGMGKQMSVASCKANGRYQLSMNIMMKLPKAANPSALSSGEKSEWNRFASFVRGHEETHKSIWRDCAAEMGRQFMSGETRDCATAHRRAMELWRDMIASCKPRQIAFDNAQRGVLKSHPFMKYASR